ncbi:MAG: hypothetical protein ACTSPB_02390 [Candidatus Thorarchaeota archaeon]
MKERVEDIYGYYDPYSILHDLDRDAYVDLQDITDYLRMYPSWCDSEGETWESDIREWLHEGRRIIRISSLDRIWDYGLIVSGKNY